MTHSNHRRGNRESLEGDWIVFAAPGTEIVNDVEKHKKFIDILIKYDPVCCTTNIGIEGESKRLRYCKGWSKPLNSGIHEQATIKDIKNAERPRGGSAVYNNKEAVEKVVRDLVGADLGFSIVISGIFDEVHGMCEKAGIKAHTVNMSGGVLGKTSLLPEPKILEFTTMCGHHFVSSSLVKHLIASVKLGKMSTEQAAVEMAKQCICNFFNVDRATKLIDDYIIKECTRDRR